MAKATIWDRSLMPAEEQISDNAATNSTRKIFIATGMAVLVVALLTSPAGAANYYVATNGSNSNSGTLNQPFLTIQQAANLAQPGDNVYVRGGTYRETVSLPRSGSSNAPIRFQPYSGEQVTISGLDPVSSGWTPYSGSIYSASVGAASQVFVNGAPMTEARWPNTPYTNPLRASYATVNSASPVQTPPQLTTITSATLGSPADGTWNGAKMGLIPGAETEWVTMGATITSQTGNTLAFPYAPYTNVSYDPVPGNRFYLYGKRVALDAPKEWYHDTAAAKLYLYAPGGADPSGQTVEVRTRELGFNLGAQSYINVSGFRLVAANVQMGGNHNLIDNSQILYPTSFADPGGWAAPPGVHITGQYNTVRNSEIAYSWGDGITISNSSNTVDNNVIHDVNAGGTEGAFVKMSEAGNNIITNNTMYNAGRNGVLLYGIPNTLIENNDISQYGMINKDMGGIYSAGGTSASGSVIAYNRIHDQRSPATNNFGIYLDSPTDGITVHHNVVYNNVGDSYGAANGQPASNDNFYNNTFSANTGAMLTYAGGGLTNVNTYNNLSNKSGWVGSSIGNNLTETSDPFVNSAAGDYRLRSGTAPVDYGRVIPGITDGYTGSAPDAGAFELGVTPWIAGANWKTWTFANQTSVPLTTALYVAQSGTRVTTGSLMVGNTNSTSNNNRAFIKFNLSGISSSISSAVLRIYENTSPDSQNGDVTFHRVLSAWSSTDVAYGQAVSSGTSFYDPANLDLYTEIDVISIVRDWLSNPSTNFGFSLHGSEGLTDTAKYFGGFYGVTAPQLVITYTIAPEPSMLVLFATGLIALVSYAWRKQR